MDSIQQAFITAKNIYDKGGCPAQEIKDICVLCIGKIGNLNSTPQGSLGPKAYTVIKANNEISRPFLPIHFIASGATFASRWDEVIKNIDGSSRKIKCNTDVVNDVLYTAIMSFALCYDIFQKTSRKTPGTFFEVILGTIISLLLPDYSRIKHIKISDDGETISTDIVFDAIDRVKLVIPAKITTRERIVQPYAHQKILDSVFGIGKYKSVLICVSEIQRDKDIGVNDICVPGTIALYQTHLAALTAIYYLDPPMRYLDRTVCDLVPVKRLAELLCFDLPSVINS